eukprot:g3984.t1
MVTVRAPTDCWAGGWTPDICCSSPGAQGNPLCWDHIYTYEKCCTNTIEGQRFHHQRLVFISDIVARVEFEIRQIQAIARNAGDCDAHARLALGPVDEDNKGKESKFFIKWIQLLPKNFANVLWYQEDQRTLVRQTYFKYILLDWEDQVPCMERA